VGLKGRINMNALGVFGGGVALGQHCQDEQLVTSLDLCAAETQGLIGTGASKSASFQCVHQLRALP